MSLDLWLKKRSKYCLTHVDWCILSWTSRVPLLFCSFISENDSQMLKWTHSKLNRLIRFKSSLLILVLLTRRKVRGQRLQQGEELHRYQKVALLQRKGRKGKGTYSPWVQRWFQSDWQHWDLFWSWCLSSTKFTFLKSVLLEEFQADNNSHTFGQAGNFPLMILPDTNGLLTLCIIDTPIGGGNSCINASKYGIID